MLESTVSATIRNNTQKLKLITWKLLVAETRKDANFKTLQEAIYNVFPDEYQTNSSTVTYWKYRDNLHVTEDVVIYKDRVVVPYSVRCTVLETFHSAH